MTTFEDARNFLLTCREDYASAYSGFRWPAAVPFNWALDWFDARLATEAISRDRPALWIVETETGAEVKLSFAELSLRSNQVANFLRRLGLKRHDRILLLLGNISPLWEVMLAALKLGVVVIPATPLLTEEELADRVNRGHVKCVITTAEHVSKFKRWDAMLRIVVGMTTDDSGLVSYDQIGADTAFAPDGSTQADDPSLLYFTSGTTAKPKLVLHSHRSYPVGHLSTMYWIGLKPGDVHLNISSPGWAKHAWSCFFSPWIAGATVFVVNQTRFDARSLLDAIARHGVTTLCAPPTVWRFMIQQDLRMWKTQLREVVSAGEPLNPEVIERVRDVWGLTIRDGYGQTETTALIGNTPGQVLKPGSMGRPLPGYRVGVMDADGHEVDEGEICLYGGSERPAGLMLGYQDTENVKSGGDTSVYRTGDVAMRDADGYLIFVGRTDDVFKSSDYRISPFELESALIEHAAVAEAAVVPSPHPTRLSVPKAFITLAPRHDSSRDTALSIFQHIRRHLSPFKRVRRIEFVADLPKTISGKIRRVQLRRVEERGDVENWQGGVAFSEEDFPELRSPTPKRA
jgi:acetyl-CoA synthetase